MANKDRKGGKAKIDPAGATLEEQWWSEDKDFESWLEAEPAGDFEQEETFFVPQSPTPLVDVGLKKRLDQIKESYTLLSQFSPKELKILMNLKRNTSAKAWTLREDLVVLTMSMSNRELAETLKDRNKEAVKKRLQLLRSKGLGKRLSASGTDSESAEQGGVS